VEDVRAVLVDQHPGGVGQIEGVACQVGAAVDHPHGVAGIGQAARGGGTGKTGAHDQDFLHRPLSFADVRVAGQSVTARPDSLGRVVVTNPAKSTVNRGRPHQTTPG
jgi:hypothetical protein